MYYYKNFDDDVITTNGQNDELDSDYIYVHTNCVYKMLSSFIFLLGRIFSFFYCRLFLKISVENSLVLKEYKHRGYFLYGNHTQPIGDVFIPAQVCRDKRFYTIASAANLRLKFIGKLLPILGIIPVSNSISKTRELYKAVKKRISENNVIVIYPEAHVWPYYTKIRPYLDTSFKFPVDFDVPVFCMTTTYYKRKFFKKPGIRIYVDGPFIPDKNLIKRERQAKLYNDVLKQMENRCKKSTYEYVEYKREK